MLDAGDREFSFQARNLPAPPTVLVVHTVDDDDLIAFPAQECEVGVGLEIDFVEAGSRGARRPSKPPPMPPSSWATSLAPAEALRLAHAIQPGVNAAGL